MLLPEPEPKEPETKETVPRPRARQIEDDPTLLGLRPTKYRPPRGEYQRAEEARGNGNVDYAIQLLLNCTKFDPVSIVYRQALRDIRKTGRPAETTRHLVGLADHLDDPRSSQRRQESRPVPQGA